MLDFKGVIDTSISEWPQNWPHLLCRISFSTAALIAILKMFCHSRIELALEFPSGLLMKVRS